MPKNNPMSTFDEGTKSKLEIFRNYIQEWLPTFIVRKEIAWDEILIYDFFSGAGKDTNGISGSALIILEELKSYHQVIIDKKLKLKPNLSDSKGMRSAKYLKLKCLQKT